MLAGTNAPGMSIGTLTVNGSATLAGTTLMEINRSVSPNSDKLSVGGALNFGGILQVVLESGATAPQTGDVYPLFNKGGGGSFTTISLPTLTGGKTWITTNLAMNGTISVVGPTAPPAITNVFASGNNIVLQGNGGVQGNNYVIVASTNITIPTTNWIPASTNVFGVNGTFTVTNSMDAATPVNFYRVAVPQ
jgi:hypothetical protein